MKPRPKPRPKGAQPGNNNALAHGFYSHHFTDDELSLIVKFCTDPTLNDEIAMQRIANSRLVESMNQVLDDELRVRMFEALSTGLGRVAKLLRDKRALSGEAADALTEAVAAALDELSSLLGTTL